MDVLLSLTRTTAGCGHSEYENMESDIPDASTDDEGLENKRRESQDKRNLSLGDKKCDGRKGSIGKSSLKAAEQPTTDDDDVRSFEEEERRMAQELTVTDGDRTDKNSGPPLSVSTCIFVNYVSNFENIAYTHLSCTVSVHPLWFTFLYPVK